MNVTPNAFLSIVSTASKSSFLLPLTEAISQLKWIYYQQGMRRVVDMQTFDEASRGPLRAFKLLWRIRFRAFIASAGAVIIILAIAIDPFTQQVLSYPALTSKVDNATSVIGVAKSFTGYYGRVDTDQKLTPYGAPEVSPQMNTAVILGASGMPVQADYKCPSGRCEWPTFESMGLCSYCEDISAQVQISCNPVASNITFCTYTVAASALEFWSVWVDAIGNWSPLVFMNITSRLTQRLGNVLELKSMRLAESISKTPQVENVRPQILSCSMSWCVRTYESKVEDGLLIEHTASTSNLHVEDDDGSCIKEATSAGLVLCPARENPQSSKPSHGAVEDTQYWLEELPARDLQAYLIDQLSTVLKVDFDFRWVNKDYQARMPSVVTSALRIRNATGTSANSPLTQVLHTTHNGNLSRTLEDIATSVTNRMRNGANQLKKSANETQMIGTVSMPVVHVHVNWPWMVYPATLSASATLFLLISILLSSGSDKFIWKSSALPLLFHGLQGWKAQDLQTTNPRDMKRQSEEMWVQLREDDTGRVVLQRS